MSFEAVDDALDALVKTVIATQEEHDNVEYAKLQVELKALREQYDDLFRRTKGMSGMLQRIRVKCDMATGVDFDEDMDEQGRAMGAEGAVGRLLAYTLGLVNEHGTEAE